MGVFDLTSTWNDSFQTLTSADEHPMLDFDLILYVGNDNDIAQLDDADVWSASGLDLPVEHKISALGSIGDDVITLSNPGNYINNSAITRWDTHSDSWSVKDQIKELDAYAFLDADNYIYAICTSGNIYYYNGQVLELFSMIRNAAATSGHQLTANFKGKPLIANGGRIYSLHRADRNFPIALVCEYTCSAGADATIHSLAVSGNNLLVSWEKSGTYGVDNISSNYATAEVYTPVFDHSQGHIRTIEVPYSALPEGCSISIATKQDDETTYTEQTVEVDSEDKRVVRLATDLDFKSECQARVTLTPYGATCPVINSVIAK